MAWKWLIMLLSGRGLARQKPPPWWWKEQGVYEGARVISKKMVLPFSIGFLARFFYGLVGPI
jgi:hypothetical protein